MGDRFELADPERGVLDDVVDVDRWRLSAEAGASDLLTSLDAQGFASAAGFLTPATIATLDNEFEALLPYAHVRHDRRSVYGRCDDDGVDNGGLTSDWVAGHLTRDMFPPHSLAQRLYVSPAFKRFVATSVGVDQVYEYADPLAGLVCTVLPPGGCYGWHYDTNEFVVTIPIRAAEHGGHFEYVPGLRRPGKENMAGARRVIAGKQVDTTRRADGDPGDLQLFRGRYALHRVSPVKGRRSRLTLVLSYSDRPGVIGPLERTRRVYGRVTEAHLMAGLVRDGADGLVL